MNRPVSSLRGHERTWLGRHFGVSIRAMKFLRAVRPSDDITLNARKVAVVGALWQFEVTARVRGEVVAEGVVVLSESAE